MEKDKLLGLRIDSDTHKKLKSLAEYDGRSINGEALYLIHQAIVQHEQTKGTVAATRKTGNVVNLRKFTIKDKIRIYNL